MRVEVVGEERDRAGNEVRRLVDVVAVGQALLDPPQAQRQASAEQQHRQRRSVQIAARRATRALRRPRRRGRGGAGSRKAGPGRRPGERSPSPCSATQYPATVCVRARDVAPVSGGVARYRCAHAGHEADHPDSLFQRGGPAPADAQPPAPRRSTGFDAVEWLIIDDGSTDRTIEVARDARRRPRRPPDQPQGPGRRLPGRSGRRAQARRGRDRQHRRRQPVRGRRHPQARGADPARRGRHGRRATAR